MTTPGKPRILVLGGGFAGLESAFYLRWRLRDTARITLVSDRDHFLFKPDTIYVPFGLDYRTLQIPLPPATQRKNIGFVQGHVWDANPFSKTVSVGDQELPYDFLVVATGADMSPEEIPGLYEHALTVWGPDQMMRLRYAFGDVLAEARQGRRRLVLFLVPPNNKYAGPLYEMAFMFDAWLRQKEARNSVEITWATCEDTYFQTFGPRLHEVVAHEFRDRDIATRNQYVIERVEKNRAIFKNGNELPFDLLVTFPPYVASARFPGLPTDYRGFIATDPSTQQVDGFSDVYAVGDAADFPIKQASLAILQADAAAEHLACSVLGKEPNFVFDPTSIFVLDQLSQATFAQVPLRLTGVPERPVEVRPDANNDYRVGMSPLWRLGKNMISHYLPWRFEAGEPFHAGLPWKGMELGLKVMSELFAH